MSKYRLSAEARYDNSMELDIGIDIVEGRLVPLLNEKDALLRQCRDFISLIAGHPEFQEERKELLDKLKDI